MNNEERYPENLMSHLYSEENPESAFNLNDSRFEKVLNLLIDTLLDREKEVIQLRFGINDGTTRTYAEIGKTLNLSRTWIHQIQKKAIRKLKHTSRLDYILNISDEKIELLEQDIRFAKGLTEEMLSELSDDAVIFYKISKAKIDNKEDYFLEIPEKLFEDEEFVLRFIEVLNNCNFKKTFMSMIPNKYFVDKGLTEDTTIESLCEYGLFNHRTYTVVSRGFIKTVGELVVRVKSDENWYMKLRSLGTKSKKEIDAFIEKFYPE